MYQSIAIVAESSSSDPILGVIAFVIAGFWFYMKMDKRDKDHEIEMKKIKKNRK